jgi:type IV pilus assembly protein PilX
MKKHALPSIQPDGKASRRAQSGLSLIFALMALVALSLGAVALVRSVDTGALVLGNLGFKQDATANADRAAESAIAWLSTANTDADSTQTLSGRNGYYASSHDNVDLTGQLSNESRELVDWDGDDCKYAASPGNCVLNPHQLTDEVAMTKGVRTQYVIFRLCPSAGASSDTNKCVLGTSTTGDSGRRGRKDYADPMGFSSSSSPYFRIIVRSVGARNTVSFTETVVRF